MHRLLFRTAVLQHFIMVLTAHQWLPNCSQQTGEQLQCPPKPVETEWKPLHNFMCFFSSGEACAAHRLPAGEEE